MRIAKKILILIIFLIFIYFRLTPIINKTVPYTYDQGRDFLKAEQIINDKHLTFIGPTTGMEGVFHGAWWYYILSFFYFIFNGWPIGFYLGLFFVSTLSIILFYYFLKKEFGWQTSSVFLLITAVSPYLIQASFSVSNNTLSPFFVLLLIYSIYNFFKTKSEVFLFFVALSLGFIFEFEVAFGLFMIAAFFISSLFYKDFRKSYLDIKKVGYFLAGITLPFIPRLLFEIKNHFIQTKAFISYVSHPTATNQQSLQSAIVERLNLLISYYKQLFPFENKFLILIISVFFIYLFVSKIKSFKKYYLKTIGFLSLLIFSILVLSLINKNNFLWGYYFDGIQFILLFFIATIFSFKIKNGFGKIIQSTLIIFFVSLNLISVFSALKQKDAPLIGLKADDLIVNYLIQQTNPKDYYCLRIYTPPVITYTYNYLFFYYSSRGITKNPSGEIKNKQCYFLFDKEALGYEFRIKKWREDNIPKNMQLQTTKKFVNGSWIELWKEVD